MEYYINSTASSSHLTVDIKELIPDANTRRRMSHVVKMGVSTAMQCVRTSGVEVLDGIVTAMGLGCLADSEKFLKNILDNDEQLLNPTPFIQSTFNTIGGQVALLTASRCYNMTYSHRYSSFDSALLDAVLLLSEGSARNVLVGAADEATPTQFAVMQRLGVFDSTNKPGEGAHFFMLGAAPLEGCTAKIESVSLCSEPISGMPDAVLECDRSYFTCSAQRLWEAVELVNRGAKQVVVVNGSCKIVVRCI